MNPGRFSAGEQLSSLNVRSVLSFFGVFDAEGDDIAFAEFIELNAYERIRVKENVLFTGLWRDEAETFVPDGLDCAFHWFVSDLVIQIGC